MDPWKFGQIVLLTALLSGYAAYLQSERPVTHSVPATEVPLLTAGQAHELWRRATTLFLDVRSAADHEYGHIAGALSMPYEDFEKLLPEFKPRLERTQALVVYCKSVDCGKSLWAAQRLRQQGLTQTAIYPGGWYEWLDHQYPTHKPAVR